jgi:mono/diheme cytochrome c family protein
MADYYILGLFHEATPTADTIDRLRELGVPDNRITVMSGVPYRADILGRKAVYERLIPIALIGALSGILAALFLVVGTPLLYSIVVGNQPIVPVPPSLIILFEFTMLGTIVATFAGLLAESRFPFFGREMYDPRITEGHIGVLAQLDESLLEQAKSILEANGAHHMDLRRATEPARRRPFARWLLILTFLGVPTAIGLLFTYAYLAIPLPDQMVEQFSIAYDQGPRLAAPAAAVPIQGPALIANQPASEPLPATDDSLQRGAILFDRVCRMCHGVTGQGDGTLASFFSPRPADLQGDTVQAMSDADIYEIISLGRGVMPSQHESLLPTERWDVINFVRSLKK